MNLSTTAEGLRRASEARMVKRLEIKDGGEDLLEVAPEDTEDLNADDGSGNNRQVFVFGLHNPFDVTQRHLIVG